MMGRSRDIKQAQVQSKELPHGPTGKILKRDL